MAATVTVSIGRNIGDEPMGIDLWVAFKNDVTDELGLFSGGRIHFLGEGTGYYEGSFEPSYTVVATVENPVNLYHTLADLARKYGQDSIALTTGNTAFPGSE